MCEGSKSRAPDANRVEQGGTAMYDTSQYVLLGLIIVLPVVFWIRIRRSHWYVTWRIEAIEDEIRALEVGYGRPYTLCDEDVAAIDRLRNQQAAFRRRLPSRTSRHRIGY